MQVAPAQAHQIGKNNLIKSHGPIAFLCLDSEEVAIIWKSLGMIGTRGHTLAWPGPEKTGAHLSTWPGLSWSQPGSQQLVRRHGREKTWVTELWVSPVTPWTLVQRCYMTLGCHYVKWQWYNSGRVTVMMMRVWPLGSDIRDITMSDRRSSILDMIRGRGKEAAKRERDAPGLERWVLGSEDLLQSRVSFVHFDKLWCMWEKTPDTDNQQLQHLRPSFVHLYLWLLMQRPWPGSQAWWQRAEEQC